MQYHNLAEFILMSLVWKESFLIFRGSRRVRGEKQVVNGAGKEPVRFLACCSENAISSSGPSLLPPSQGACNPIPEKHFLSWENSREVKAGDGGGWGQRLSPTMLQPFPTSLPAQKVLSMWTHQRMSQRPLIEKE